VSRVYPDIPGDVWNYPVRTLTQAKFPFWSAIITQTGDSGNLPGGASVDIDIRPPPGETWLVFLTVGGTSHLESGDIIITYNRHDGTTPIPHGTTTFHAKPFVNIAILTNSMWGRLHIYNTSNITRRFAYGYSGFKLSQPLHTVIHLDHRAIPFKVEKPDLPLPEPIKVLDKYKALIYGLDPDKPFEYALGVILEEDTPLAVDPNTGYVVERKSVYVLASKLADLVARFKSGELDYVLAGYEPYLKKWKAEGIDLGIL
jgi:hypothetical protein